MTRLTTRRPSADPSFSELIHDLTEVAGQLVCGFPPLSWLKPGSSSGGGSCGSCGSSGGCDCGSCGCGSCGSGSCGSGGAGCDSCGSCGIPGCPSCGPLPVPTTGADDACWPCWLPRRLAPVCESVCAGSTLRVRFCVTNHSLATRTFIVAATGPDRALAAGAPSSVAVEPMGSGELVAVIRVPAVALETGCIQLTLWVRGCFDHIVPVTIVADGERCGVVARRAVVEQPDTCHTWRDHFYISRRCGTGRQVRTTGEEG